MSKEEKGLTRHVTFEKVDIDNINIVSKITDY